MKNKLEQGMEKSQKLPDYELNQIVELIDVHFGSLGHLQRVDAFWTPKMSIYVAPRTPKWSVGANCSFMSGGGDPNGLTHFGETFMNPCTKLTLHRLYANIDNFPTIVS
jgi:hypothetical protein